MKPIHLVSTPELMMSYMRLKHSKHIKMTVQRRATYDKRMSDIIAEIERREQLDMSLYDYMSLT